MDAHGRIERLETEIEALAAAAERAGKVMLVARVATALGGAALAAILLGILRAGAPGFMLAVSTVLVGIVLYGSNRSTRQELLAGLAARREARDALIDALALRSVDADHEEPRSAR